MMVIKILFGIALAAIGVLLLDVPGDIGDVVSPLFFGGGMILFWSATR